MDGVVHPDARGVRRKQRRRPLRWGLVDKLIYVASRTARSRERGATASFHAPELLG